VDTNSRHFRNADYLELILGVEANTDKLPNLKVLDGSVYRRREHTSREAIHDTFCWKLWVPQGLVLEAFKKALGISWGCSQNTRKIKEILLLARAGKRR